MVVVKRLVLGALGLAAAAAIAPALAQVSPFGPGAFNVPDSDLPLLGAAEAKLYTGAKVGAVEKWSNAATGDDGSVTLISTFERDGMPCRRLAHVIKLRGIKAEHQFVISRCRVADGSWKIVP
ncbi:MAG TPA: RT0821/Lpp0805 family surface protein [Alphaproteobacteria bacterium]|jgi:surface antigen|nr:RT0821/Lpp0805 family surface protein [Alphaproteobacteria bacterium]